MKRLKNRLQNKIKKSRLKKSLIKQCENILNIEDDLLGFHMTEKLIGQCDICDEYSTQLFNRDGINICINCLHYENDTELS